MTSSSSSSSPPSSQAFPSLRQALPLLLLVSPFLAAAVRGNHSKQPRHHGAVGVTYTMNAPGVPPPRTVVEALKAAGVTRALLLDPYPDGVAAFNGSGIALCIAINNTHLPFLAANKTNAFVWMGDNIVLPTVAVHAITVGYNVLTEHRELAPLLLPAIHNLYDALAAVGLAGSVRVSTRTGFGLVAPPFPPSAARFNASAAAYVEPLVEFLAATNSSLVVDVFPFREYRSGAFPGATVGLATFNPGDSGYLLDRTTGLVYDNLFDAMVDATVEAMAKLGHRHLPVECLTGWPSAGGVRDLDASILLAGEYNGRLTVRLNARTGTPAWPGLAPVTYIYSLFDEPDPRTPGLNWGIWTTNLQHKYVVDFTSAAAVQPAGLCLFFTSASFFFLQLLGVF